MSLVCSDVFGNTDLALHGAQQSRLEMDVLYCLHKMEYTIYLLSQINNLVQRNYLYNQAIPLS